MGPMFPPLADPSGKEAIRFPRRAITYRELAGSAAHLAARVAMASRVAVWATPDVETCVAVVAAQDPLRKLGSGGWLIPGRSEIGNELEGAHGPQCTGSLFLPWL